MPVRPGLLVTRHCCNRLIYQGYAASQEPTWNGCQRAFSRYPD